MFPANIPNTGSFTWTPSKDLKGDDDYAIQIIAGASTNYSPKFEIKSEGKGLEASTSSTSTKTSSASKTATSTEASTATSETASASESAEASASAEESTVPSSTEEPITAVTDPATGAAGKMSSPLALVLCIVASLVYFH
jgi:hypothetical protein